MRRFTVVLALTVAACAVEPTWIGGNEADLMKDLHDCQVEAELRWSAKYQTQSADLITAAIENAAQKSVFELKSECMAARAWRAEYPPGTPPGRRPY